MVSSLRSSVVLLLLMLACCNGNASPEAVVDDLDALIRELRNEGATVNIVGSVSQPFFSASGQVLRVNGEDVQVFEYENAAGGSGRRGSCLTGRFLCGYDDHQLGFHSALLQIRQGHRPLCGQQPGAPKPA